MIYFISVLLAQIYSIIASFIGDKQDSWSPRQLITSGVICLYADLGAVIAIVLVIRRYF